ncbi:STAS/SEC14 domain-containing protein [Enhygromyxa salina]|uniref:STAS/SEC14 domain-containing protein n=1 Tax=Enhygromyxa salina TaxID=215803 RepID=UPI0015E5A083|nr:STAS/SEC14 domain-containing protein [Enhygromyxa salina]
MDDVHLAVHGPDDPDATDWEGYLGAARKILETYETPRVLVYTLGGGPSGTQRSMLNKINEGLSPRVAVMLESRMARGTVTALSWFNPSIKAFSLTEIDKALAHLELTGDVAGRVKRQLDRLKIALNESSRG